MIFTHLAIAYYIRRKNVKINKKLKKGKYLFNSCNTPEVFTKYGLNYFCLPTTQTLFGKNMFHHY